MAVILVDDAPALGFSSRALFGFRLNTMDWSGQGMRLALLAVRVAKLAG